MCTVGIPEWFKVGAKAYLYGVSPAYEVMEIKDAYWIAKDIHGDLSKLPLDEVLIHWRSVMNDQNEPIIGPTKYRLRLNGDPELEVEVGHAEEINDTQVIVDDIGNFGIPHKTIVVHKLELFGDDGELYAMRKLPPHLVINFTPEMTMSIQFRLTICKKDLAQKI